MSYVTLEVEIDHGRIVAQGDEKLPEKGTGLLTILQPSADVSPRLTPLEAFKELQRRMQLTPEKAEAWKAAIREARS